MCFSVAFRFPPKSVPIFRVKHMARLNRLMENDLRRWMPGNRYLDGSSRGNGEGNYNYVVFDDTRVGDAKAHSTEG